MTISVTLNGENANLTFDIETTLTLQVIWEQLNGALYDLEHGQPSDAIVAVEDCIKRLENLRA